MYKKIAQHVFNKVFLIIGLAILLFYPTTIQAAEDNVVGFNYQIEYPSNQLGGEVGYFDLELAPGTEQDVFLKLSNSGKEAVAIDLSVNGTKTNSNGVLEYGPTDIENDKSLQFPFESIVSAPEKVELKAGETKDIPIKIKMPETSFDGIILGGIHMKKAETEEKEQSKGATVRNTYSYIVAMRLQNNDVKVQPKIELNEAQGTQQNYRNSVAINLSNVTGVLVKDKLDIESQITKKGSKEVLYERKQSNMSIAPNSQMNFYVSMSGEQMVPGEYTAHVLATIEEDKWEKDLDFTITKEQADKYNKRDVGLVQDRGLDWKLIISIVIGFLSFVIIIFILIKVIKNQKSKNKKKVSNNKVKNKKRSK